MALYYFTPLYEAMERAQMRSHLDWYTSSEGYKALGRERDQQFAALDEAAKEDKFREYEGREDAGQATWEVIQENIRRQDGD